jgi:hypothetical protein
MSSTAHQRLAAAAALFALSTIAMGSAHALNPQPLPPKTFGFEERMLNPQPLPPRRILMIRSHRLLALQQARAAEAARLQQIMLGSRVRF